jgi:hypothetical protein
MRIMLPIMMAAETQFDTERSLLVAKHIGAPAIRDGSKDPLPHSN